MGKYWFYPRYRFKYRDGGQIGYIGKGQSVYQTSTFQGGGKLMYYFKCDMGLPDFEIIIRKSNPLL